MAVLLRVVSTDFDFEGEYLESGSLEYEGVQVYVAMLRNFTHLNVTVSYMMTKLKVKRFTFLVKIQLPRRCNIA